MEIWKDINPGFPQGEIFNRGKFQISSIGRGRWLFANGRIQIKKPIRHIAGYWLFSFKISGVACFFLAHRLVAEAFIPNPNKLPEVNHLNGIKTDNRVENLEWCTHADNVRHGYATGLTPQGANKPQSKLSAEQAEWCRSVYIPDDPIWGGCALARKFGVTQSTIARIVKGKTYKNAQGEIHQKFSRKIPSNLREEIRRLYVKNSNEFSSRALARRFGISKTTVLDIVREN